METYCGTEHYCPPEVLAAKFTTGPSEGAEVVAMTSQILTWAIGMVMHCLLGTPKTATLGYLHEMHTGSIREVSNPTLPTTRLPTGRSAGLPPCQCHPSVESLSPWCGL